MQAQDFQGKHRLPARHVDWLIYILRNRVVLKYALREQEKCSGRVYNADARKRVNDAILAAKAQKEGPKKMSSCEFTFLSNSEPGRTHVVTLLPGKQPQCTCIQHGKHKVCWHVVSCMLLQGFSEHALLMLLGTLWGSQLGGYEALWATKGFPCAEESMAAYPEPVPVTNLAQQARQTDISEDTGGPKSMHKVVQHRVLTPQDLEPIFQTCRCAAADLPAGCPVLQQAMFYLENAVEKIQAAKARYQLGQHVPSTFPLLPNPDAAECQSLRRLKDFVEKSAHKHRNKENSRKPNSLCVPFPALAPRAKHPNVRAELREEAAKERARLPQGPLSRQALSEIHTQALPIAQPTAVMQLTGQLLQGQPPQVPPNSSVNPLSAFQRHLTTSSVTPGLGVSPLMPHWGTVQPQAQTRSMPYQQMPPNPALGFPSALASQNPSPAWVQIMQLVQAGQYTGCRSPQN